MQNGHNTRSHAATARFERYDRWYPLLMEELRLVAAPGASVIAVGGAVAKHLALRGFPDPFTQVLHYSGQAALARNAAVVGREDAFTDFSRSVSLEAFLATAEPILAASGMPAAFRDETLNRLRRSELTTSRKKLMFSYKLAFEALGGEAEVSRPR